jgi:hypothetical protein
MADGYDSAEPMRDPAREPLALNRRQRDVAVVGWCSFLAAAASTMVFFAFVDPLALGEATEPPLAVDRMTGYALGFFFFWTLAAASAALAVYMIRTRQGHPPPPERR